MKTPFLLAGLFLLLGQKMIGQNTSNEEEVREAITGFVVAADVNDAEKLAQVLDPNFRIVMNQLFGSSELMIMDRATYLEKIKLKEFGGDKRAMNITNVLLNGNNATAKVELVGSKMTFISILNLVKNKDNQWLIISDTPSV